MKHLIFTAHYGGLSGLMTNEEILSIFHTACERSDAHIRRSMEYSFFPKGFTAVVILAESHAAIHTWPENSLVRVDYFSCSENPNCDVFMDCFSRNGFIIEQFDILER